MFLIYFRAVVVIFVLTMILASIYDLFSKRDDFKYIKLAGELNLTKFPFIFLYR